MTADEAIQAAVRAIVAPALRLIQQDPHQWSTRGCTTCSTVTALLGQPFGCDLYRQQRCAPKTGEVGK